MPILFVNSFLSKVMICDTFATESFGKPVTSDGRRTFPGARAHFRLLVKGRQITVAIRLRFSESD